jgi:TolA-binding protein
MKKGEIYYSLGNYSKAAESYKEFLLLFSKSKLVSEAMYWIAKSESMLGNNDEAVLRFIELTNTHLNSKYGVDAVIELGELYTHSKRTQEALSLYTSVIPKIKEENRVAELLFKKAMMQIDLKDYTASYTTLTELVNYYEGSIFADKAKIELSIMEMSREEYSNAEILLKELGENRQDDIGAQAQYLYGIVLYEQEKIDDAISALVRVRSVFSNYDYWYSKSLIALGDCYKKRKDNRQAREMYRAVIQKHSNDELGAEARKKLNSL